MFLAGYTCFPPCALLPLCLEQRALNNSWWLEGTACATLFISPSSQPDCYCSSREQGGLFNTIKLWETVAVTLRVWLHAIWSWREIFKERRCLPVSTLYCKAYVYTQTLTCTCIRKEMCVHGGKSCLHQSQWQKFPLTLAGQGFSNRLCRWWDVVQAFRHTASALTHCRAGGWQPSHASNALKCSWGVRARPQAKPHAPAVVPRCVVMPFCVTSELEQLCLPASHKSIPGSDLAYLKGLAGVFGCLFGFGLRTFSLFVCFLVCLSF